MKLQHAARGLVWIGIGAAATGYGFATGTHLVLWGTSVPWGPAVMGVGVLILIWDVVRGRKQL